MINELEMKCKKHLSHKTKFPSDHFSDFNTKFYIRVAITNQNIDIIILKNIENSLLINCFSPVQLINKEVTNKNY